MHSGDFITLSSFWYLFLPLLDDVNLSEAEKTQFIYYYYYHFNSSIMVKSLTSERLNSKQGLYHWEN